MSGGEAKEPGPRPPGAAAPAASGAPTPLPRAAAVVVAAGRGRRLGGEARKQFVTLGDRPVLAWALGAFARHPDVTGIVAVVPEEVAASPPAWLSALADEVVAGGETRPASVVRGLTAVGGGMERVLVHDGVRPFASADLIARVARAAEAGGAVPVLPVVDTLKEVDGEGRIVRTVPRDRLGRAQTPQGFPLGVLREAYGIGEETGGAGAARAGATDDAAFCESRGVPVLTVPGEPHNLKITDALDLAFARWLVAEGRVTPS